MGFLSPNYCLPKIALSLLYLGFDFKKYGIENKSQPVNIVKRAKKNIFTPDHSLSG